MRILYLDIDSLRPDHLGCYGYHRNTSPNIDALAAQGIRYRNCHATDVPCLPSRTAMFQGRHGIHTGVINHGGVAADPFIEGIDRGFRSRLYNESWPALLRRQGYYTAMISPFGERHAALQIYCGFNEIHNPIGKGGNETADEVTPTVLKWLDDHREDDDWFLHVNLWDPHTPYRSPDAVVEAFADDPLPAWYTEEVRQRHWAGCGPHSAREVTGYGPKPDWMAKFTHQPGEIDSMAAARAMFDGYDAGVRYADEHVGQIIAALEAAGILDDTAIIITADHGENLGELNIYGDHQTADQITTNIPMIVRWPGVTDKRAGSEETGLCYHIDVAASVLEQVGGRVPAGWDGVSFAADWQPARPYLVVSQGAWSCQRGVRFDDWFMLRSYHDGHHDFPDYMLFNLVDDPHEQHDLAAAHPEVVQRACAHLDDWLGSMMRSASTPTDPMWTVLHEGGPLHTRGHLPEYLERLRASGRADCAERLAAKHPAEC